MVGEIFRRLRASERLRAFVGELTREHLVLGFLVHERPLDRRARCTPTCAAASRSRWRSRVLSCADRLATRGEGQEPWIAGPPRAGARGDGAPRCEWRADGPPRPPRARRRAGRRAGHRRPGPSWAGCWRELEAAAYAGEVSDRDQAVALARRLRENRRAMIVDCAVYEARGAPRRGARARRGLRALPPTTTRSCGSACYEPTEEEFDSVRREFDLHELAVEDAIHAHQRPEARGVRRHDLRGAQDRALRGLGRRSSSSARS